MLDSATMRDYLPIAMKRFSLRQMFVLLLMVFVTVGMDVSVVQASDMAVKMAMTSDMNSSSGHDGCNGCDASGKTKAVVCTVSCVTPVSVAFERIGSLADIPVALTLSRPAAVVLLGKTSPPDPFPPRSI